MSGPAAPPEWALFNARAIGGALQQLSIRGADGAPGWMAMLLETGGRVAGRREADWDFYSGRTGIAFYLAALAHVTGDERHGAFALSTLAPLINEIGDPAARKALADRMGLGVTGVGGMLYGLTRVARWTGDEPTLRAAYTLAEEVTPERLEADPSPDVILGTTGALLGLLALHGAESDAGVLERAVACGESLVRRGTPDDRADGAPEPKSGYAHGAAGYAHALVELHRATGRPAFLACARAWRDFEARLFVPALGNWRLHPGIPEAPEGNDVPWCTWCSGAPGIGMSRAAAAGTIDDAGWREDLEAALATVRVYPQGKLDQLCCGSLGRADFLLEAGRTLGRPELVDDAYAIGDGVVERARERGVFHTGYNLAFTPGLFQGLAGIGYQLLRFHDPERVPSLLLFR